MWLLIAKSESGDDYNLLLPNEPTDEELEEWCHDTDGCPEREGSGDYGSYVHIYSVEKA